MSISSAAKGAELDPKELVGAAEALSISFPATHTAQMDKKQPFSGSAHRERCLHAHTEYAEVCLD